MKFGLALRCVRTLILGAAAFGLISIQVVSAQGVPPRNAAVLVYTDKGVDLLILPPAAPAGGAKPIASAHTADATIDIAPDGKTFVSNERSQPNANSPIVYQTLSNKQPSLTLPVDQGYNVFGLKISQDGRYLAYTEAKLQTQDWLLGIVNLTTKTNTTFAGKYYSTGVATAPANATNNSQALRGIAVPIGWNADDKQLITAAFVPFADGNSQGYYSLDVSNVDSLGSTRQPFPAFKPLALANQGGIAMLSPDGKLLVYQTTDPANPTQGFTPPEGPGSVVVPVNTLNLLTLATGASRVIVAAAKGQAIEAMTWSQDSKQIMFTSGSYNNSSTLVSPHIFSVDVTSAKVTQGPQLSIDEPPGNIVAMLACADSLFYAINRISADGTSSSVTLESAPLSDLKAHGTLLVSNSFTVLLRCVPNPA